MRVALVHEWMTNMAGSEKVVAVIRELYPEAPVYTSLFEPDMIEPSLSKADVHPSILQRLPKKLRKHQLLLPLMPYAFEQFNFKGYDLVISSSHACAKGILVPAGTIHLCYCHTPIRYAWDFYHDYIGNLRGPKRWFAVWFLHRLRLWDQLAAQRVDYFIANSNAVAKRILKHYGKPSLVIYPPVEVERFRWDAPRSDYYVVISRLVHYKRVDLAVQASLKMRRKLYIIGVGEEEKKLKRLVGEAGKDLIHFLDWQSEEQIVKYLSEARAFLFPGEEDFGITMVEALASGCPVLAYAKGGALDILQDGENGYLFNEQSVESLIGAIERFEANERSGIPFDSNKLRLSAERFNKESFKKGFLSLIADIQENSND